MSSRKVIDLFVLSGLCKSKNEAKKLHEQDGLYINNTQIPKEISEIEESQLLFGKYLLLRRGKKNYHLLVFADNPKVSQIVNLSQQTS